MVLGFLIFPHFSYREYHSIPQIPGAAEYAFALDNLQQAVALRNQILGCFRAGGV